MCCIEGLFYGIMYEYLLILELNLLRIVDINDLLIRV